jgi:hypothetical protein
MVQQVHGGVVLPQEQIDGKAHWEFDDIAVGLTVQEKAKRVSAKFWKASPPA